MSGEQLPLPKSETAYKAELGQELLDRFRKDLPQPGISFEVLAATAEGGPTFPIQHLLGTGELNTESPDDQKVITGFAQQVQRIPQSSEMREMVEALTQPVNQRGRQEVTLFGIQTTERLVPQIGKPGYHGARRTTILA
jgi:hypothetical protein